MQFPSARSAFTVATLLLAFADTSRSAEKWNYKKNPVKILESTSANDIGLYARLAFDGYGADNVRPGAANMWFQPGKPKDDAPFFCVIDYGKPIAVSAFVNHAYIPNGRDLRYLNAAPYAFKRVRISYKDASDQWKTASDLTDLPAKCPQTLPVRDVAEARVWRVEVFELVEGADKLCTYELETYTGGVPEDNWPEPQPHELVAQFENKMRTHKPVPGKVESGLTLRSNPSLSAFSIGKAGSATLGDLALQLDGKPCTVKSAGQDIWQVEVPQGLLTLNMVESSVGVLLTLDYVAKPGSTLKYQLFDVRLTRPNPSLYFMPAYVWSKTPADMVINSANAQTRMAGLAGEGSMLCLFPGTDRGRLGISGGAVVNTLLLGPGNSASLLIASVQGDWWDAYRFASKEIYGFDVPRQTVPVSEVQFGVSNYLIRGDVWDAKMNTLKLWPEGDPEIKKFGQWYFNFYSTPFTIPAYWSRHVMNDDKVALDRCKGIVNWLCKSGIRIHEGPTKGAFFTMQMFPDRSKTAPEAQGCSWPGTMLTSQSTGSALYALVYYRRVTGDKSPEVDQAIEEAALWLLKTQTPAGGWPFGHYLDGRDFPGIQSSGTIWNIWALWRLGKDTGNTKYLEAAERAKTWFTKSFVEPHYYHGYWEDMGTKTREGYEAAVATLAFAEMGDKELAVKTAKDAIQWVFTRQIEPREANNSAGLVSEQLNWPPAHYCNPMMGVAAHTAWEITGDDFWKPYAMIPKALGWWYQADKGALFWTIDDCQMAPLVGPGYDSYWQDWSIAQPGGFALRWLVREACRRSGGAIKVDDITLQGKVLGHDVKAWSPESGIHPIIPVHGQVNWLGFRDEKSVFVAFMNDAEAGGINCRLDSRAVSATIFPKALHRLADGQVKTEPWNGAPVTIDKEDTIVLEWDVRP
jgi:hypothetical protein